MNKLDEPFALEEQLHSLLCGALSADQRQELLGRLAREEEPRRLLAEMLEFERACRRSAGLDGAEARASRDWEALRGRLTNGPERAVRRGSWAGRAALWTGWWARAAAAVVVLACAYGAWSLYHGKGGGVDGGPRGSEAQLSTPLTAEELERFRTIWSQVAEGGGTWVLVKEGSGQFGSIAPAPKSPKGGTVLLVQCRVVNDQGQLVYSADVLLPDEPSLKVRLPEAGLLAGQRAALAVTAVPGGTTVGLSVQDSLPAAVGVTGQAPLGSPSEVGRFRLHDQDLRFLVRTQKLEGFPT